VNNAGVVQVGPITTMTIDDFRQALAVNFWGALHATFAALPLMRTQGGGLRPVLLQQRSPSALKHSENERLPAITCGKWSNIIISLPQ
jgi:NAD(P)-dependent dehydrogenase (short-subunit alcohol dehydrogenase family)